MTGPRVDPVADYLAAKNARAPAVDPVAAYKAAKGAAPDPVTHDIHEEYRSGRLAKRMARENTNDAEALAAEEPSYAQKALGGVASLARDIPGAEFLQAGARSIVRRQPYDEARADIRSAEDAAPSVVRNLNRTTGGVISAMAMPKLLKGGPSTVAAQGAQFGALSGALSSDPTKGIRERGNDAVMQGALGAIAGKGTEGASNLFRVGRAKTTGAVQEAREAARSKAADPLYDAARAEGAAGGGTSPGVKTVLDHPLVKPLADDIRESYRLQGKPADDATVLMQAGRELGQNERALIDRTANAASSRPLTAREQGDVKAVRQMIRDAASNTSEKPALSLDIAGETTNVAPRVTPGREPVRGPMMEGTAGGKMGNQAQVSVDASGKATSVSPRDVQGPAGPAFELRGNPGKVTPGVRIETPAMRVQTAPAETVPGLMPSLPKADAVYAEHSGELKAMQDAADATDRIMKGKRTMGKKLGKQSPEAFQKGLGTLKEGKAKASTEGMLGEMKNNMDLSANPLKLFGLGPNAYRAHKIGPYLRTVDETTGGDPVANLLRALGISTAGTNR